MDLLGNEIERCKGVGEELPGFWDFRNAQLDMLFLHIGMMQAVRDMSRICLANDRKVQELYAG